MYKFKRRILNGLALNYTLKNLLRIIYGFYNTKRKVSGVEVESVQIRLHELPCYVISLNFRNDRRRRIMNILQNKVNFIFVDAVHGKSLHSDYFSESLISPRSKKFLTKGSIGCLFSHFKAWEIAQQSGKEYGLFFEDDITIQGEVEEVNKLFKEIPADFDIILLGSSNNILLKGNKIYNRSFYDVIYPRRGMFAYLLKISSIPKILDNIYPIRICAGGIDTLIGWLVLNKKIKVYHIKDKIIDVDRNLPSNIINPSKQNKLIHIKEFL